MNNTYKSAHCDSSHLDRSFNSTSIFSHLRHLKVHLHIRGDNNKRTPTVPRCVFRSRVTFTLRNHTQARSLEKMKSNTSLLTRRLRNNLIPPQQGSHRRAGLIRRLWSMFQREDRIQIPPCKSKAAFCWLTFPVLGRVESRKHDVERSESNRVEKNKGRGGWWTDYD